MVALITRVRRPKQRRRGVAGRRPDRLAPQRARRPARLPGCERPVGHGENGTLVVDVFFLFIFLSTAFRLCFHCLSVSYKGASFSTGPAANAESPRRVVVHRGRLPPGGCRSRRWRRHPPVRFLQLEAGLPARAARAVADCAARAADLAGSVLRLDGGIAAETSAGGTAAGCAAAAAGHPQHLAKPVLAALRRAGTARPLQHLRSERASAGQRRLCAERSGQPSVLRDPGAEPALSPHCRRRVRGRRKRRKRRSKRRSRSRRHRGFVPAAGESRQRPAAAESRVDQPGKLRAVQKTQKTPYALCSGANIALRKHRILIDRIEFGGCCQAGGTGHPATNALVGALQHQPEPRPRQRGCGGVRELDGARPTGTRDPHCAMSRAF